MIESSIRNLHSKLDRSLKTLEIEISLKLSPVTTTSKWQRRYHLILLTAQLVIIGFGIMILWLLRQSQLLVSYLFDGLKRVSTFILTRFLRQKELIMLWHLIQIRYTSLLTNLLTSCLTREQRLVKLSPSWIDLQKRSWNHLLITLIRLLLKP